MKTQSIVERSNGVIRKRFFNLHTGMRERSMTRSAELVMCAIILRNHCIRFSDNGEDLLGGAGVNIVEDNFAIEAGREHDNGSSLV